MPSNSASAIFCRYSGRRSIAASFSFEMQPTSARMAGMSVATSTMNGARLTPQFSSPASLLRSVVKSCFCTASASSCDSSRRASA